MPMAPATDLVTHEPVQGLTPTNAENLFAARRPTSIIKEPVSLLAQ